MNDQPKKSGLLSYILFILFALIIWNAFVQQSQTDSPISIDYNEFLRMVESDKFQSIVIQSTEKGGSEITGCCVKDKDGKDASYNVFVNNAALPAFMDILRAKPKIKIFPRPIRETSWLMSILINWAPMLLFIFIWIFFMRKMGGGVSAGGIGGGMDFGKSKAKMSVGHQVTFADVAGVDESKEELVEMINFLKDPKKFTRLGGRMPKGVLLIGPPGTGKTLLARAVAGEAGVAFFSLSGSEFVEMFVGVGASRVRDLFENAKKNAPSIIFIDEIDAIGGKRGMTIGGGRTEQEQTLNQLMVEMDGFDPNVGIIIMAATNRPEVLDVALLRPGRFDRHVVVPRPDVKGREEILKVHARKKPLAENANLTAIARGTPGFVGADLENLLNEAALKAAQKGQETITHNDLEEAKDKIIMGGAERKSMVMSPAVKKVTAYHEAGHTLVAKLIPGNDPVHKVTLIPRGMSLGLTGTLPEEERHNYTKSYLEALLPMMMGGRCAEELVFKDISTGARNDIERATELASNMVKKWGMSEKLGPLNYGKDREHEYLGFQIQGAQDYSEKTAQTIDEEKKQIIDKAYRKATDVLAANRNILEALASALLEKETLTGEEVNNIVKQFKISQAN